MTEIVISLIENTLKVSAITENGFTKNSVSVPEEICSNTQILDVTAFSEYLKNSINNLGLNPKAKNGYGLSFILEPENYFPKFVTVRKNVEDTETVVLEDIKSTLEGVTLEELYYSYNKIAPFTYSFIGVRKSDLDKYIEVANIVGIPLNSVISWVSVLPKYVDVNEPAIFVLRNGTNKVLVLSDLNGVYFSKTFGANFTVENLSKAVEEVATYKREEPIKKIYALDLDNALKLKAGFDITKMVIPNSNNTDVENFEVHLLMHYMLDMFPAILTTPINLLSLLPLPAVEKKSSAVVYAGVAAALILVVGGVFAGKTLLNSHKQTPDTANTQIAANSISETQPTVLSETKESTEPKETTEKNELKRDDLKIKVENGAGVSGLASKTRTLLVKVGYKEGNINIGDADIVGRQNTLLKFKKDKIEYKELLSTDMKDNYLDIVVQDDLDSKEDYDVLIIVGTNVKGL